MNDFDQQNDGLGDENLNEVDGPMSRQSDFSPWWGDNAPRGGKIVLNRVLKDGSKVSLFLGQTLVNSLRDVGYNSTTSALCEHVDNAIQAGASEIRVYFHQVGKLSDYKIAALVMDNGKGMAPHVLKVASSFGGSMSYDNRSGIAFGLLYNFIPSMPHRA